MYDGLSTKGFRCNTNPFIMLHYTSSNKIRLHNILNPIMHQNISGELQGIHGDRALITSSMVAAIGVDVFKPKPTFRVFGSVQHQPSSSSEYVQ